MTEHGEHATAVQQVQEVAQYWWLWLIVGIAWVLFGFIVLQFDFRSVTAIGIVIGVMFLVAGLQYIATGTQVEGWNWLWYVFGALLIAGGLAALFNPQRTFLAIVNILGFLFLMVGVIWIIEAFMTKDGNDLWWLTLAAGIMMIALAFWLGNSFFFEKAETLFIFAGVWALMRGIIDIIAAFQIRKVGKIVAEV